MGYNQVLQAVDTLKALDLLELKPTLSGSYVHFNCTKCQGKAVAKAYGVKKNLIYCPKCKTSGHIISLVQKVKKIEYDDAVQFLKGISVTMKKPAELKVSYDLQYHDFLKNLGIEEETAQALEIGVPKGKTMLSGCVAFKVFDEGNTIAYYGIKMKDLRPVFHKSFNPELFLYQPQPLNGEVIFTPSLFECVRNWQAQKPSVSNFGLPYLSPAHIEILNRTERIIFEVAPEQKKEFAIQAMELETFYRFA